MSVVGMHGVQAVHISQALTSCILAGIVGLAFLLRAIKNSFLVPDAISSVDCQDSISMCALLCLSQTCCLQGGKSGFALPM